MHSALNSLLFFYITYSSPNHHAHSFLTTSSKMQWTSETLMLMMCKLAQFKVRKVGWYKHQSKACLKRLVREDESSSINWSRSTLMPQEENAVIRLLSLLMQCLLPTTRKMHSLCTTMQEVPFSVFRDPH